jgi:hypothetical protein
MYSAFTLSSAADSGMRSMRRAYATEDGATEHNSCIQHVQLGMDRKTAICSDDDKSQAVALPCNTTANLSHGRDYII